MSAILCEIWRFKTRFLENYSQILKKIGTHIYWITLNNYGIQFYSIKRDELTCRQNWEASNVTACVWVSHCGIASCKIPLENLSRNFLFFQTLYLLEILAKSSEKSYILFYWWQFTLVVVVFLNNTTSC